MTYVAPACAAPAFDESFFLLISRGFAVQRDDDYARELLREMEASDQWMHVSVLTSSSGPDGLKRHFHVLLLVDAGFLAPMTEKGGTFRITSAGHDFLTMTRQAAAWEAIKAVGRNLGGASLQMLYRIGEGIARQKLAELGLPVA